MYLTKVNLNAERSGARQLLSSNQRLHAAVMKSFSQDALDATIEDGRPLFRVETGRDPAIYIASPVTPDVTHIVEEAGRPNDPYGVVTADYAPVLGAVREGSEFAFKVRVNPVHRVKGSLVPHITPHHIEAWFSDKFTRDAGVVLNSIHVSRMTTDKFVREGKNVTLASADIQGVLTVENPELLRTVIMHGFGRAKGYGFGLVTLARTS